MRELIKSLLVLTVVLARIYCVIMVIYGLYLSRVNKLDFGDTQWYIFILILDLYMVKIFDNSNYNDIYTEKKNEKGE